MILLGAAGIRHLHLDSQCQVILRMFIMTRCWCFLATAHCLDMSTEFSSTILVSVGFVFFGTVYYSADQLIHLFLAADLSPKFYCQKLTLVTLNVYILNFAGRTNIPSGIPCSIVSLHFTEKETQRSLHYLNCDYSCICSDWDVDNPGNKRSCCTRGLWP